LKLRTAAALVSIPDNFYPATTRGADWTGHRIFLHNKSYISLFFKQDGALYAKESGFVRATTRGSESRMLADSSLFGGPAITTYYDNGSVSSHGWAREGELHRDSAEGPALFRYERDGRLAAVEYRNGGRLHRPRKRGPALYYVRAKDVYFGFWEDGICLGEFSQGSITNIDQPLDFFEAYCRKEKRTK
jgi:hypothetical protein